MKIQSLYFSNGNIYIGGIFHRLSVTLQVRLFTNDKKLKSLFPLKNKNLKNVNIIIWDLRKGLISERKLSWVKELNTKTQLDEHDSLSSLFTQNIYYDFLSCVTIRLLYLAQKAIRHYRIFSDTSPSFCVMSYFNIMWCSVI